jgi:ribosomal protein L32
VRRPGGAPRLRAGGGASRFFPDAPRFGGGARRAPDADGLPGAGAVFIVSPHVVQNLSSSSAETPHAPQNRPISRPQRQADERGGRSQLERNTPRPCFFDCGVLSFDYFFLHFLFLLLKTLSFPDLEKERLSMAALRSAACGLSRAGLAAPRAAIPGGPAAIALRSGVAPAADLHITAAAAAGVIKKVSLARRRTRHSAYQAADKKKRLPPHVQCAECGNPVKMHTLCKCGTFWTVSVQARREAIAERDGVPLGVALAKGPKRQFAAREVPRRPGRHERAYRPSYFQSQSGFRRGTAEGERQ